MSGFSLSHETKAFVFRACSVELTALRASPSHLGQCFPAGLMGWGLSQVVFVLVLVSHILVSIYSVL